MNNHLKVLSETDTSLSDRIFPKPQFMTPLWIPIVNQKSTGCFFKLLWVLLRGDADEAHVGDSCVWKHMREVHGATHFRMAYYKLIMQSQKKNFQNFF